ncbi:MAG TPA: class I SAM-dependent methyltransferase [Stellaceae bacterium]|nr:class I SAM-dependent methyltransferase [Stellaceae bacterium]
MAIDPEHERWNARFAAAPDYVFGTAPNQFLVSQRARLKPGQKALAVADGEGRNGVWLAQQGLEVLSVDVSPAAQDKAKKLAAANGVAIATELADITRWRWPVERFDVVAAIMIQFAQSPAREAIFGAMKTALKRGGLVIIQGYRPEQLAYKTGGPPNAENMYTEEMLRREFGDFAILHLRAHDDPIAEGAGHSGMSALIDMVAQKP